MTTNESDTRESIDLEPRDVRALTECMTVLPEGGDIYTVVGENGRTYAVDALKGRCTCPDYEHNLPTDDGRQTCKHAARVTYAEGMRPIPLGVDGVDELLGEHTEGVPRVVASDGGEVLEETEESDEESARPDSCECWNAEAALPCFKCYLAGFRSQNPAEPASDG